MKFRSLTLAAAALAASFSAAEAQNYSLAPTFGVISLQTGYLPDPNWVSVLAGGSIYVTYPDVVSGGTDDHLFLVGDRLPQVAQTVAELWLSLGMFQCALAQCL